MSGSAKYDTPVVGRYQDMQREDEGQTRFDYQFGRSKLFAKGAANQHVGHAHPLSARQENFVEASASIPASCAACQSCLSCRADKEVFCSNCNESALKPAPGGIASLYD
jgi:hypothetical protein